jgi:SAM-dependent methyltransferase
MSSAGGDRSFAGSIPLIYERYMVPLIFEHYAEDLVARVTRHRPARVLELAAGTGVVTRRLAIALAPDVAITATDLNQPMLDHAASLGTARRVDWQQADAMQLPYAVQSFDAVVCQFGVMFFPDKAKAFAEARRVLRPGGVFIFNVWDWLDRNEFAHTVSQALAGLFPNDPPQFMARVPHGYHDAELIARDLQRGGFSQPPELTTLTARSRASAPQIPAIAFCQGTPLRNEIEARAPSRLNEITEIVAAAIARRFGSGSVEGKMQALVVTVQR